MKSGPLEVIMSKITTNRSVKSNKNVYLGRKIRCKPESLEPQEKKYTSLPEDSVEAKEHYEALSFTNIAEDINMSSFR